VTETHAHAVDANAAGRAAVERAPAPPTESADAALGAAAAAIGTTVTSGSGGAPSPGGAPSAPGTGAPRLNPRAALALQRSVGNRAARLALQRNHPRQERSPNPVEQAGRAAAPEGATPDAAATPASDARPLVIAAPDGESAARHAGVVMPGATTIAIVEAEGISFYDTHGTRLGRRFRYRSAAVTVPGTYVATGHEIHLVMVAGERLVEGPSVRPAWAGLGVDDPDGFERYSSAHQGVYVVPVTDGVEAASSNAEPQHARGTRGHAASPASGHVSGPLHHSQSTRHGDQPRAPIPHHDAAAASADGSPSGHVIQRPAIESTIEGPENVPVNSVPPYQLSYHDQLLARAEDYALLYNRTPTTQWEVWDLRGVPESEWAARRDEIGRQTGLTEAVSNAQHRIIGRTTARGSLASRAMSRAIHDGTGHGVSPFAALSGGLAALGQAAGTVADATSIESTARQIPFDREGAFVVKAEAIWPTEHGHRWDPTRVAKLIHVRSAARASEEEAGRSATDLASAELALARARAAHPNDLAHPDVITAQRAVDRARVTAGGRGSAVISQLIADAEQRLAQTPVSDVVTRVMLSHQIAVLREQLEHVHAQEAQLSGGHPGSIRRLRAAYVSNDDAHSYQLVWEMGPTQPTAGNHHVRILDTTLHDAEQYDGVGGSVSAAIIDAIDHFSRNCPYGHGSITVYVPRDGDEAGAETRVTRPCVPGAVRDFMQRLDQLAQVGALAALFVPGLAPVAAVASAAVAVNRLVHRASSGNWSWDAQAVADLVAVALAVVPGIGAQLGRAATEARGGVHALQDTLLIADEADLPQLLEQVPNLVSGAVRAERLAAVTGQLERFLNHGSLFVGDYQLFQQFAELELQVHATPPQITEAEAMTQRFSMLGSAIQSHAFLFVSHGAGHGAGEPAADHEAAGHEAAGPSATAPVSTPNTTSGEPSSTARGGQSPSAGTPTATEHSTSATGQGELTSHTTPTSHQVVAGEAPTREGETARATNERGRPATAAGATQPVPHESEARALLLGTDAPSSQAVLELWFRVGNWAEGIRPLVTRLGGVASERLHAARMEIYELARAQTERAFPDVELNTPGSVGGAGSDVDPTMSGPRTLDAVRTFVAAVEAELTRRGLPTRGWREVLGINPYSDGRYFETRYRLVGRDRAAMAHQLHQQEFVELQVQHRSRLLAEDPTGGRWLAYVERQRAIVEDFAGGPNAPEVREFLADLARIEEAARAQDAALIEASRDYPELAGLSPEQRLARLRSPEGRALLQAARAELLAQAQQRLRDRVAQAGEHPTATDRFEIQQLTMRMKNLEEESYHTSAVQSVVEAQQGGSQGRAERGLPRAQMPNLSPAERMNSGLDNANMLEEHLAAFEHLLHPPATGSHEGAPEFSAAELENALKPAVKYLARLLVEARELGMAVGPMGRLMADLSARVRARIGIAPGAGGNADRGGAHMGRHDATAIESAARSAGLARAGGDFRVDVGTFLQHAGRLVDAYRAAVTLRRAAGTDLAGALAASPGSQLRRHAAATFEPTTNRGNVRPTSGRSRLVLDAPEATAPAATPPLSARALDGRAGAPPPGAAASQPTNTPSPAVSPSVDTTVNVTTPGGTTAPTGPDHAPTAASTSAGESAPARPSPDASPAADDLETGPLLTAAEAAEVEAIETGPASAVPGPDQQRPSRCRPAAP
jgi:hypothetical protein